MRCTKYALMALLIACAAMAKDNSTCMPFWGFLTETEGEPISGTRDLKFELFDAATGGSLLWSEVQSGVSINEGNVSVSLGTVTSLAEELFTGKDLWLNVTINPGTRNEEVLSPRSRISTTTSALSKDKINSRGPGGSLDLTISEDLIVEGSLQVDGSIAGGVASGSVASGSYSFTAGYDCDAAANYSTIGGGYDNYATHDYACIGGGYMNEVRDYYCTVSGGSNNEASADYSFVGGGRENVADQAYAVIGGGYSNESSGFRSTVAGGANNNAKIQYSTVGGGCNNEVIGTADVGTIAGGSDNIVSGQFATIAGGKFNMARGAYSFIGGGGCPTIVDSSSARGLCSVICGGKVNDVDGDYGTIGGGLSHEADGDFATIPGGYNNTASGDYAFAAGKNAFATHQGSFVWGDSYNSTPYIASSANDQVTYRASGGYRIFTNTAQTAGMTMSAGGSQWNAVCDRNKKRNIRPVDTEEILSKVDEMQISQWSYKSQDPSIEHISPMAQDFYAAFGIGESDTTISTLDPSGVALAAIQELSKRIQELECERNMMAADIANLQATVDMMAARDENVQKARFSSYVPTAEEVSNTEGH